MNPCTRSLCLQGFGREKFWGSRNCVDFEHGMLLIKQQLCHARQAGGFCYLSSTKNSKSRCLALAPSVLRLFRMQKLKQNRQRLEAGDLWTENNLVFSNSTGGCFPIGQSMTASSE